MRFLRVASSMDPAYGGPPQGIRNSITALKLRGIENEVACCDPSDVRWRDADAFQVHALGPGKLGIGHTPALLPWLYQNIPRFDGVVLHGMWQWTGVATLRAVRRIRATSDWSGSFHLMPHGMLDPWFQRDRSRRAKAVRNWFYWWLAERAIVNGADGLLFTCQEELLLARTTFLGYRPKKERNIGYGISSIPEFQAGMAAAFKTRCPSVTKPYLLSLGRIHPKKGLDLLVRAYSADPRFPADLVIAGPGWESRYGREILQLAQSSPAAAKIHTLDMLEGDAKWGALHGCKAFILPSHQENFGIAVVEALSCNKPVLISDKVNIWREIHCGDAGLVESDTLEGTCSLLARYASGELEGKSASRFRDCFMANFEIQDASRRFAEAIVEK